MRRLSIVMTYRNRVQQFEITLRSIALQKIRPEIIVVDDASDPSQSARPVVEKYLPVLNIRLIEIRKEQKWWMNPCIPYNMGFSVVTGDVTIIQNPECVHFGEIMTEALTRVADRNYCVFSCYPTTRAHHAEFQPLLTCPDHQFGNELYRRISPMGDKNWYTHPTLNPTNLHFCTALTTANLQRIGGFNEEFADGYCFDDNAFLLRIRHHRLSVEPFPVSSGFVVHQWHEKERCGPCPEWYKNQKLYQDIQSGKQPV